MTGNTPVVDVSNPGAVNTTYAQVAALQALGYGGCFFTSYYFKGGADALAFLPRGLREKALRQLRRRQGPGINPARVRNLSPWLEALYVAASRGGAPAGWGNRIIALRNRRFDRRVAALLAERRPDLVIGNDGSAEASFARARELGIPCLLNQVIGHDAVGSALLAEEYRRDPDFASGPPQVAGAAAIETRRREALSADGILAPSDYVRQTLREIGVAPERIHLLPYGVDVTRFRPPPARPREGPLRLLYVGRIEQRKGLRYLLEAMKAFPPGTAELTLVGNKLVPEAALAPYRELFRHLPNQPYHRIHEVFADADVFIYPSLHEGSALAVYEALASGLPVVATPNTGSVVRDGREGFLVPIRDSAALAERIRRLAEDESLRQQMAADARAAAETYTWARYADSLNGIIQTMLAGATS